jgi:hypothetical protein
MLARIVLIIVLTTACSGAMAATTITEDRDNDIRNPYQKSASANCDSTTACKLTFPSVPKGQRLLISYISCLITNSAPVGVLVELYPASTPRIFVPFYPSGVGDSLTSNEYFSVNAVTRLYVNAGDAPAVALTATSPFVSTSMCFISGETVTLP